MNLPSSGLSEVTGIVSDTVFKNTVKERRIVTPENPKKEIFNHLIIILEINLNFFESQ